MVEALSKSATNGFRVKNLEVVRVVGDNVCLWDHDSGSTKIMTHIAWRYKIIEAYS